MINLGAFEQALRQKFGKFRKGRGKRGLEYKVCCTFCLSRGKTADTKYKLNINPEKGVYRCWRCEAKGPTSEMFKNLAMAERTAPPVNVGEPLPVDVEMPGELSLLTSLPEDHPAIEYLQKGRKRPFDPYEVQELFGVRYCTKGKMYAGIYDTTNTIIFPIFFNQRVIGWQSRMMVEPENLSDTYLQLNGFRKDDDGDWIRPPKYFTSPAFPKGRVMFNWDIAVTTGYIVVCEGTFDAMAVGAAGVATLGKGLADEQVVMLADAAMRGLKIIIMLDDDAVGEANELLMRLRRSGQVVSVTVQGYHDAGDAPRDEIWRQIYAAIEHRNMELRREGLIQ